MAEWSIATDCKSVGHRPTKVRILLGARVKNNPPQGLFLYRTRWDSTHTVV